MRNRTGLGSDPLRSLKPHTAGTAAAVRSATSPAALDSTPSRACQSANSSVDCRNHGDDAPSLVLQHAEHRPRAPPPAAQQEAIVCDHWTDHQAKSLRRSPTAAAVPLHPCWRHAAASETRHGGSSSHEDREDRGGESRRALAPRGGRVSHRRWRVRGRLRGEAAAMGPIRHRPRPT